MSFLAKARKPKPSAPIITIVGSPGAGKTTLGARFPKPVFITAEDGLAVFDDWAPEDQPTVLPALSVEKDSLGNIINKPSETILKMIAELSTADHDFETLVIDSITALDRLFGAEIVARDGVESVAEAAGGYQKAFGVIGSWHAELLQKLGDLRSKRNMAIVLLAHTGVERRKNLPDSADDYAVYSMDMHRKSTAIYTSESDAVLYLAQETIVEGAQENKKGQTTRFGVARQTGRRALITSGDGMVGYVHAKNRYNLPKTIPVKEGENPILSHIKHFGVSGSVDVPAPKPESKPEPFDLPPKFDKSAIIKEIAGLVVSDKWTPQIRSVLVERFEGAGIKYPEPLISGGLIAGLAVRISGAVDDGKWNKDSRQKIEQLMRSGLYGFSDEDISATFARAGVK